MSSDLDPVVLISSHSCLVLFFQHRTQSFSSGINLCLSCRFDIKYSLEGVGHYLGLQLMHFFFK